MQNRKQYVSLNGINSETENIVYGVPQGSVLGPLLFLIYVNDISNINPKLRIKLFADDTYIFLYNKNIYTLINDANKAMHDISIWFRTNKLSLNVEKTNYCIFRNKFILPDNVPDMIVGNKIIKRVENCKYLGIAIDDRLTFAVHIRNIVSKIQQYCGMYYKLRSILPLKCLRTLYFALVYPHLIYGIEIYGNTSKTYFDPLCKVNNRILRILQNKSVRTPIHVLYSNYNTLPILGLRDAQLAYLMHKYVHHRSSLPAIYLEYFVFNKDVHSYNTRESSSLHSQSTNKSLGARNLKSLGVKIWNNIPKSIRFINNFPVFKRKIKQIYLSNISLFL